MCKMVYASTDVDKVPGDGNGKEVKIAPAYYFGQTKRVRYKNAFRRKQHKIIAEELANTNSVGYSMDQSRRYGLWNVCVSCNWDINAVLRKLKKVKIDTDCSQFYACCVNLVYREIKFEKATASGNICDQAKKMSTNFKISNIDRTNYLKNVCLSDAHIAPCKHVTVICEK